MADDADALELTRAPSDDLAVVALVLEEASAWLHRQGIEQWPLAFSTDWIGPPVERGETWLARVGGNVAGTLTVATSDPAWPDGRRDASYVHRLAVRRAFAGLGAALLDWVSDEARRLGHRVVRLDCVSSNPRLRRYYEDAGFRSAGQSVVHGTTVTLFERPT